MPTSRLKTESVANGAAKSSDAVPKAGGVHSYQTVR
jgi:hypothetical protein